MQEREGTTGCQDEGNEPEQLARFLEEEKGYRATDIERRLTIVTRFNDEEVTSKIALLIRTDGQATMILRYAPGSVVTRERSAVAAARVLVPDHQIPLVVVTNGREAVLLDTYKGRRLAESLADLPTAEALQEMSSDLRYESLDNPKKKEREMRILNAFDVDL
ncbi:MAG: type I restriction enzyme HsdR N-terminal domain-containing protein [Thermodesulfobacteriota bacterium]